VRRSVNDPDLKDRACR